MYPDHLEEPMAKKLSRTAKDILYNRDILKSGMDPVTAQMMGLEVEEIERTKGKLVISPVGSSPMTARNVGDEEANLVRVGESGRVEFVDDIPFSWGQVRNSMEREGVFIVQESMRRLGKKPVSAMEAKALINEGALERFGPGHLVFPDAPSASVISAEGRMIEEMSNIQASSNLKSKASLVNAIQSGTAGRSNRRLPKMTMQTILAAQPGIVADLAWLGRHPDWIQCSPFLDTTRKTGGEPGTAFSLHLYRLVSRPGYEQHNHIMNVLDSLYRSGDWPAVAAFEAISALYAGGPKRFTPTEEQFESMEQVELHMPINELRTPYPAMKVTIPPGCRLRLAREHGLKEEDAPLDILVRLRHEPGENPMVITLSGEAGTGQENFYLFQHQEGNPTIEAALKRNGGRWYDGAPSGLFDFGLVVCRTALNLCQMLTHFGHRLELPRPPVGQKMNRAARRAHQHHGDWATVHMKQEIVIRQQPAAGPALNQPGLGLGHEVKPHWRKGHWAAYPGTAKLRAEGRTPPLYFRRPTLVRSDRVVGDLKDTDTPYHG